MLLEIIKSLKNNKKQSIKLVNVPTNPKCSAYDKFICNVNQNFYRVNKMSEGIRIYLLTYTLEQNLSWEAYRFSASQDIPRILCNPKLL